MSGPVVLDLATTSDPVALVPGSAPRVRELATVLEQWSTRLSTSADAIKTMRVPSWTGQAADAFNETFAGVPSYWYTASDQLQLASRALGSHADVIDAAQSKAQDAIDKWRHAADLTSRSHDRYDAAVRLSALTRRDSGILSPPPVYVDGGAAARRDAIAMLEEARNLLDASGTDTLDALVRTSGGSTSASGTAGPGNETSWSWGSITSDQWKDQWGKRGWAGLDGAPSLGLAAVLASGTRGAWVWRGQGQFTSYTDHAGGHVYGDGTVEALAADATGSISFAATEGLQASLDAEANLVKAQGSVGYANDFTDVSASAAAQGGAYAKGDLTATTSGVEVGGEVLLGGRAGVDLEASLAGVGVVAGIEGWAGAGAGGGLEFKVEDGRWIIGENAGLAWGFGAQESVAVVLDPQKMADAGQQLWAGMQTWW